MLGRCSECAPLHTARVNNHPAQPVAVRCEPSVELGRRHVEVPHDDERQQRPSRRNGGGAFLQVCQSSYSHGRILFGRDVYRGDDNGAVIVARADAGGARKDSVETPVLDGLSERDRAVRREHETVRAGRCRVCRHAEAVVVAEHRLIVAAVRLLQRRNDASVFDEHVAGRRISPSCQRTYIPRDEAARGDRALERVSLFDPLRRRHTRCTAGCCARGLPRWCDHTRCHATVHLRARPDYISIRAASGAALYG